MDRHRQLRGQAFSALDAAAAPLVPGPALLGLLPLARLG
jgi:hypothetical protein